MLSKRHNGSSSCCSGYGDYSNPQHHGDSSVRDGRMGEPRSHAHPEESCESSNAAKGGSSGVGSQVGSNNTNSNGDRSGSNGAAAGRYPRKRSSRSGRKDATDYLQRELPASNQVATAHLQRSLASSSSSSDTGAEQLSSHQGTHNKSIASLSPQARPVVNSEFADSPAEASPEKCSSVAGSSRDIAAGPSAFAVHTPQLPGRGNIFNASAPAASSPSEPFALFDERVSPAARAPPRTATVSMPLHPSTRPVVDPARASTRTPNGAVASSPVGGTLPASHARATQHEPSAALFSGVESQAETANRRTTATATPYASRFPKAGHPERRGAATGSAVSRSSRKVSLGALGPRPSANLVSGPRTKTAAASWSKVPTTIGSDPRVPRSSPNRPKAAPLRTTHVEARNSRRSPVAVPLSRACHPEDSPSTAAHSCRGSGVISQRANADSHSADSTAPAEPLQVDCITNACMRLSLPQSGTVDAVTHDDAFAAAGDEVASGACAAAVSPTSGVTPCAGVPSTSAAAASEGTAAADATTPAASALLSLTAGDAAATSRQTTCGVYPRAVATCSAAVTASKDLPLQQQQSKKNSAAVPKGQLLPAAVPVSDFSASKKAARVRATGAERLLPGQPGVAQNVGTAAQKISALMSFVAEKPFASNSDTLVGEEDARSRAVRHDERSKSSLTRSQTGKTSSGNSSAADLVKGKTHQKGGGGLLKCKRAAGGGGEKAASIPRSSQAAAQARLSTAAAGAVLHAEDRRYSSAAGGRAEMARPAETPATAAVSGRVPAVSAAAEAAGVAIAAAEPQATIAGRVARAAETSLPAKHVSPAESSPDSSAAERAAPTQAHARASHSRGVARSSIFFHNKGEQTHSLRTRSSNARKSQGEKLTRVLEGGSTAAGAEVYVLAGRAAAREDTRADSGGRARCAAAAAAAQRSAVVARSVTGLWDGCHGGFRAPSVTRRSSSVRNSSGPVLRSSACAKTSSSTWVNTRVGHVRRSSSSARKELSSSVSRRSHSSLSEKSSRPSLTSCGSTFTQKDISSAASSYSRCRLNKSSNAARSNCDGSEPLRTNAGEERSQLAVSSEKSTPEGEQQVFVGDKATEKACLPLPPQQQETPASNPRAALAAGAQEPSAQGGQGEVRCFREAAWDAAAVQQAPKAQQPADTHPPPSVKNTMLINVGQRHQHVTPLRELPTPAAFRHAADLRQHEQAFITSTEQRQRQEEDERGSRQHEQQQGRETPASEQLREGGAALHQHRKQQPALPLVQQQQEGGSSKQIGMPSPLQPQLVEERLQRRQQERLRVLEQQQIGLSQQAQVAGPPPGASQRQEDRPVAQNGQRAAAQNGTEQRRELGPLQQAGKLVFPRRHVAAGGTDREDCKVGTTAKVAEPASPVPPSSFSSSSTPASCSSSSSLSSSSSASSQQQVAPSYSFSSSVAAAPFLSAVSSMSSSSYDSSVVPSLSASNSSASDGYFSYSSSHTSSASSFPDIVLSAAPPFFSAPSSPLDSSSPCSASLNTFSLCSPVSFDTAWPRLPHHVPDFEPPPSPTPVLFSTACGQGEAAAAREPTRATTRAAAAPAAVEAPPPAAPRTSAGAPAARVPGGRRGSNSLVTAAARSELRLLEELRELPGPEGQHARTLASFLRRHTGSDAGFGLSNAATPAAPSTPTAFSSCPTSPVFYSTAGSLSELADPLPALAFSLNDSSSSGSSAVGLGFTSCGSAGQLAGDAHTEAAEGSRSDRNAEVCSCEGKGSALSSSSSEYRAGREAENSSSVRLCDSSSSKRSPIVAGDSRGQCFAGSARRAHNEEAQGAVASAGLKSSRLTLCGMDQTTRRSSAATATTVASASEARQVEKKQRRDKQRVGADQRLVPKPRQQASRSQSQAKDKQHSRQRQPSRPRPRRASQRQRDTHSGAAQAPAADAELSSAAASRVIWTAGEASDRMGEIRPPPAAARDRRPAAHRFSLCVASSLNGEEDTGGSFSDGAVSLLKRHGHTSEGGQGQGSDRRSADTAAASASLVLTQPSGHCSSEDSREEKFLGMRQLPDSSAKKCVETRAVGGLPGMRVCSSVCGQETGGDARQPAELYRQRSPLGGMETSQAKQQQQQQEVRESQDGTAQGLNAETEGSRRPWKMSFDVPRLVAAAAAAVGRNYRTYFGRANTTTAASDLRVAGDPAVRLADSLPGEKGTGSAVVTSSSRRDGARAGGSGDAGAATPKLRRLKSMPPELQTHSRWRCGSAAGTAQAEVGGRDDGRRPAAGQEVERQLPEQNAAEAAAPHEKRILVRAGAPASVQPDVAAAAGCYGDPALQDGRAVETTVTATCAAEGEAVQAREDSWEQQRDGEELQLRPASSSHYEEGRQQPSTTGATSRRRSTCRFCRARAARNYRRRRQSAVEGGGGTAAAAGYLLNTRLLASRRIRRQRGSTSRSSTGVMKHSDQSRSSWSGRGSRSSSKSSTWSHAPSATGWRRRRKGSRSVSSDSAGDETRRDTASDVVQRARAFSPNVFAGSGGGRGGDIRWRCESSFDRLLSPEDDTLSTFPSVTLRRKLWTTATMPAAVCRCSGSLRNSSTQRKDSQQQALGAGVVPAERHSFFYAECSRFTETETASGNADVDVGDWAEPAFGSLLVDRTGRCSLQSAASLASGQPCRRRRQGRRLREGRRRTEQEKLDGAGPRTAAIVAARAKNGVAGAAPTACEGADTSQLRAAPELKLGGLYRSRRGGDDEDEGGGGGRAEEDSRNSSPLSCREATAPPSSRHLWEAVATGAAEGRRRTTQDHFFSRGGAYDLSTLWPSHQQEELRRGVLGWFRRDIRSSYLSFSSWFGPRSADPPSDRSEGGSTEQQRREEQEQHDGETTPDGSTRGYAEHATDRRTEHAETTAAVDTVSPGETAAHGQTAGASDGLATEAAASAAAPRHPTTREATKTGPRTTSAAVGPPLTPKLRRPFASALPERAEEASSSVVEDGARGLRPQSAFITAAHLLQQPLVSPGKTSMDNLEGAGSEYDADAYFSATEERKGERATSGESSPRSAGASTGQLNRASSLWPRLAAEEKASEATPSREASGGAEERPWKRVAEALIAGARSRISATIKKEEDRWSSWSSQVAALSYSPRVSSLRETSSGPREMPSRQKQQPHPSRAFQREAGAVPGNEGEEVAEPGGPGEAARRDETQEESAVVPRDRNFEDSTRPAAANALALPTRAATAPSTDAVLRATEAAAGAPATTAEKQGEASSAVAGGRGTAAANLHVDDSGQQHATLSFAEKVGGLLCRVSSCSWVNPPARRPSRVQRILAKAQKRDLALFVRRRLRRLSNSSGVTELRNQRTSSSSSGSDSSDDEEGGRNSWSRDVAAVASTPPPSPALVRSPKGRDASSVSSAKRCVFISETLRESYAGCASDAAHALSQASSREAVHAAAAVWSKAADRDGSTSTRSSSSNLREVREQTKHEESADCDSWKEGGGSCSSESCSSIPQLSRQAVTLSPKPCSARDQTAAMEETPGTGSRETALGAGPRLRTALQRSNTIPFAPDGSGVGAAGGRGGCVLPAAAELNECLRAFPQCILEGLIRGSKSSSWLEQQRQLLRCRRRLQKHRRRLQAREPSLKMVHSSWRSLGDWQLVPNRSQSETASAGLPQIVICGAEDRAAREGPEERRKQLQQAAGTEQEGKSQQTPREGAAGDTHVATIAAGGHTAAADPTATISRRLVFKSIKRNTQDSAGGLEEGLRAGRNGAEPVDDRAASATAAAGGKAAAVGRLATEGEGVATVAAGKTPPDAAGKIPAVATGEQQSQNSTHPTSGRPTLLPNPWNVRDSVSGRRASGPPAAFRDCRQAWRQAAKVSAPSSPALPRSDATLASGRQDVGDSTETASRGRLSLWLGAHSIPRDDKRYRGGEDAWFLSSTCNAMGVADGVSEWEDLAGINPQKFAQDLMRGTFKHLRRLKKLEAVGLVQGIRAAAAQRISEKKGDAPVTRITAEGSPGTGRPARAAAGGETRGRGAGVGDRTASSKEAEAAAAGNGTRRDADDKSAGGVKMEEDGGEERDGGESPGAAADGCASLDAAEMARVALTWSYHEAKHYGSSTALVGVLDERTGVIDVYTESCDLRRCHVNFFWTKVLAADAGTQSCFANLGDSSGMVLRRLRRGGTTASAGQPTLGVVRRVKEMQHSFNVPYQFGHVPAPEDWNRLRSTGLERLVSIAEKDFRQRCNHAGGADGTPGECAESAIGDLPTAIEKLTVRVQEGDLILIGTDGLFDNVFDYEITALSGLAVSPAEAKKLFLSTSHATPPSEVARALALAAYWRSLDPNAQTPFSKETKKQLSLQGGAGGQDGWRSYLGRFAVGGKEDDITVVAAWVVTEADATPGLVGTGVVPGESLSQEEEEMLLVDEDD